MADPKKRLQTNIAGDFFVDSTCINCDTCRQLAPAVFAEKKGYSCVSTQPSGEEQVRQATRALLACPTGSIGTVERNEAKKVMEDFPLLLEADVYYCGFNSPRSYGGNSYFVKHEEGNWLIDSPKYLPQLVKKFHEMDGLKYIFLTHKDDVADAEQYAREFGAKRILHAADLSAQPDSEIVLDSFDDVQFGRDFLAVPTPGHTEGHCVLLYKNAYLFTGDHLDWDRDAEQLGCFPDYCWYSWDEQKASIAKSANYRFEWILPGHGQRVKLRAETMKQQILDLSDRLSHLE